MFCAVQLIQPDLFGRKASSKCGRSLKQVLMPISVLPGQVLFFRYFVQFEQRRHEVVVAREDLIRCSHSDAPYVGFARLSGWLLFASLDTKLFLLRRWLLFCSTDVAHRTF